MKRRIHNFPKAIVATIALVLLFSLVSTAKATTIPGVPYHSQIKWYYCGPACLEMLFNYYGTDISQTEIAGVARTDPNPPAMGTYMDDMIRAAQFSDLSTSVGTEHSPITGYTGRGLGYAAFGTWYMTMAELKTLIDSGYPIIVLMRYGTSSSQNYGHFRVVIGYDDGTSVFTLHDPIDGANIQMDYSTFDYLWNDWSWRWGEFVSPWQVVTTAPASVSQGSTFTVSSTAAYPCPSPFNTLSNPTGLFYPASSTTATISLPAGLSLALGETATKTLGSGTLNGGGSASVQWNVKADNPGSYSITVEAEGHVSGAVSTHGSTEPAGYSYTDRIGGTGESAVTVTGAAPSLTPPVASFTESPEPAPVGTPISFDATASYATTPGATIMSYAWDFGDGATATGVTTSHAYAAPGPYTVTLTVTDTNGLTGTLTATKTITGPQAVIPEVPIGTVLASVSMILALATYLAIPRWKRKVVAY
jgi:PKD repeat protein